MMQRIFPILLILLIPFIILAQQDRKPLDEQDYISWNNIEHVQISNNGRWIVYEINPNKGDGNLMLYDVENEKTMVFPCGKKAQFDFNSHHLIFLSYPPEKTVDSLKRLKVKEHKLPTDTLKIIPLDGEPPIFVGDVSSYTLSDNWGGWIFYELEARDSSWRAVRHRKPTKNESILIQRNLNTGSEDTILYALDFAISDKHPEVFILENPMDTLQPTFLTYNDLSTNSLGVIYEGKGSYNHLITSDQGGQLSFIFRSDTLQDRKASNELLYWHKGIPKANSLLVENQLQLQQDEQISDYQAPYFSKNGQNLFFGVSPPIMEKDSTLLPEEVVDVEIWSYLDNRLYTQQEISVKEDKEKSFLCIYDLGSGSATKLGSEEIPHIIPGNEGNASKVAGLHTEKYAIRQSWEGRNFRDVFIIDVHDGAYSMIATEMAGQIRWSPDGHFVYWFDPADTSWYSYEIEADRLKRLTNNQTAVFVDELNDKPMLPDEYGAMGWADNDQFVYIYDRYDIWEIDPSGESFPRKITTGRASSTIYRYLKVEPEERSIDHQTVLVHSVNELTKQEGYHRLNLETGEIKQLLLVNKTLSSKPIKAKNSENIVYTEETFVQFPDLIITDSTFNNRKTISRANPQQEDHLWGNAELVSWTAPDGLELQGLLIKPDNFDPNSKYPMIVNFYERSSETLYTHRTPAPHRSTINYSYYASNGYLIFNPDIVYDIGHPGASALRSVVSGTNYMISKGYVDQDRIGLQGHSWGGYQIAHIITKTDMFRCAESGAPVVNMVSAYGGIRWGSGMSRMFQYEKTQSRLGATLWEKPELYLENSPIFQIDRVHTPVLILHNDGDTAVPWYQGIEFFLALRRLNKPAWLLNYNDEPHWPLKWQNRIDFNKRMFQFFEHYLKDAALPHWMKYGVPAIEKGINLGYELMEEQTTESKN